MIGRTGNMLMALAIGFPAMAAYAEMWVRTWQAAVGSGIGQFDGRGRKTVGRHQVMADAIDLRLFR